MKSLGSLINLYVEIMQGAIGRRISTPRTREKLSFYAANKRGDSHVIVDRINKSSSAMRAPLQIDAGTPHADNYCFDTDDDYSYVTEIDCTARGEGGRLPEQRFQKLWDHISNC